MTTDHDAEFTAWVERTAASLRGTAYLMCGDWHTADDVVQDALVRVYERWHRIRPEAATSYARRVVATATIDRARRPWRREVSSDVLPEVTALREDETPYDVVGALGAAAAAPASRAGAAVLRRSRRDRDRTAARDHARHRQERDIARARAACEF